MTKKINRWKSILLLSLAGIFALATIVSLLALASISGIGAGLVLFAAAKMALSPIAFVTLTTIIGLGLTVLTAGFAVYVHKEIEQANKDKKNAPQVVYMSRPKHLDTPHLEWAAKRNQMKELLLQKEGKSIYANAPKELQQQETLDDDNSQQHRP